MTLADKEQRLVDILKQYDSAAIAFSGGVDSALLSVIAAETIGGRVLLITAQSAVFAAHELDDARRIARRHEIAHEIVSTADVMNERFRANPPDRCYHCKRAIFEKLLAIAADRGYAVVCDGSNRDDSGDYRPGRRALAELGVVSPLREAGLGKAEIRELSRRRGLPTADKPSCACLASRFPYGQPIVIETLRRVDRAESALRARGFFQVRVRVHGDCARVELAPDELMRGWEQREAITRACTDAGFAYVAIDTRGYRTGAMNETLARDIAEHGEAGQ